MKKIINGMRFDTEKAIEVGNYCTPISKSDFNYCDVSLYKTPRSGRFFLAGEGGPMTRFGKNWGDGTRGFGEKTILMSTEQALEWAEQYLDAEEIEAHFDIEEA